MADNRGINIGESRHSALGASLKRVGTSHSKGQCGAASDCPKTILLQIEQISWREYIHHSTVV